MAVWLILCRYCRACYLLTLEQGPGVKCPACVKEGDGDEDFASLNSTEPFPDHAIKRDMGNQKAKYVTTSMLPVSEIQSMMPRYLLTIPMLSSTQMSKPRV